MKIYLYYIGKPRDLNANRLAADYIQRCERFARCQMREVQPNRFDPYLRHPAASKILLDPAGKTFDSIRFANWFGQAELEARDLVFLVGGAEGLPAGWRERGDLVLSLSAMTYSHELARVMLAEQIYRAFTILRGHPYAK